MTILMCSTMLSGTTGLDKAVVTAANGLNGAGYHVVLLNFVGPTDGSRHILSRWPFDPAVTVQPLRTLAARGGRHLHEGLHPVVSGSHGPVRYAITPNELAALRQINDAMVPDDTIIFTHPLQARVFAHALDGRRRRPRTILQIHGDYAWDTTGLWDTMIAARSVIDRLQVVAEAMRPQFLEVFDDSEIDWIPNIQEPSAVTRQPHEGVEVAVVGSFSARKNQLDAVRALARVPDPDVRLTLWGNHANDYGREVAGLVSSLGLEDRVSLPGVGTERDIYSSADMVLMPSESEGFPYVLSEALSHAVPVVAYDFDFGPRDVIEDGASGHIVPAGDVAALADRVARLAADADLRRAYGRRSREIYDARLSTPSVISAYRRVLGPDTGNDLDLLALFPPGSEPVAAADVSHRLRRVGRRRVHLVTVRSRIRLHDVRIDNGERIRAPRTLSLPGRTLIAFSGPGTEVVSYTTAADRDDRHYLANTTRNDGLEVLPYLRRDAAPGDVLPGHEDAVLTPASKTPAHRELPRHPRYPVIGGEDSFGAALNQPGGVEVRNSGTALRPTVAIRGEHDWLVLRDALGPRRVEPPYGYAELFERVCAAERDHGLFEMTTDEGVHCWELYRAAFISQACEALGMWGGHFAPGPPVMDVYAGPKRLSRAPTARRVLFEFPRKPSGVDHRTRGFVDDDTLVISYPQTTGYTPDVDARDLVLPIYEFNLWRRSSRRPTAGPVDPRPFEDALTASLGLKVVLNDHLRVRTQKFLEEREFWTPVLARVQPEEVVIPSSHWSAGICAAARAVGARASDVQYALTGRYHPSYWFGARPRHGAQRLYAWSELWAGRTNGYDETVIAPRDMPELERLSAEAQAEPIWDVCVVSQPRVFRRIMAFVESLVRERPDARVVVAPHPDERQTVQAKLVATGLSDRVVIAPASTLETIRRSAVCVGGYSTSLFEAAAMGVPTYVLPVPGHELMLPEVASGLLRTAFSPADLVPFEVPAAREDIFATGDDAVLAPR